MKSHVYADHAATTPLCDAAWNAMIPFLREEFGNPSSLHTWAKKPREAVWAARVTITRCVGAEPEEIYFTSGGTEADNWEYEEAFVSNLHLVGKEGWSYAAALLFSEKAEKWIPVAYVKVGMFDADDSELIFNALVHKDYGSGKSNRREGGIVTLVDQVQVFGDRYVTSLKSAVSALLVAASVPISLAASGRKVAP